jgi:hypothetical protein
LQTANPARAITKAAKEADLVEEENMREKNISLLILLAIIVCLGTTRNARSELGQGPCEQIKAACERAGFVEGGANQGNGLTWDCVVPIVQGTPQPNNTSKPLPQIDPQIVAACKANNPKFGQPKNVGGTPGVAATPGVDARTTAQQTPTPTPSPTGSQYRVSNLPPSQLKPVVATTPRGPLFLTFGSPITFATHKELTSYGFSWGPSDGQFGAIPAGGKNYTFYGAGGSSSTCSVPPNTYGAYTFIGTLNHVTGGNGCTRLFGPGDGPVGWIFDRDYAGGGKVIRFASGGRSGWLMPFHAEYQWKNMQNPPSYRCKVDSTGSGEVSCFYGSLGLAVSTDNGKTFKVVGQIVQSSQPLSFYTGGGKNVAIGYGSLVVADANGKHLDNPPADPNNAYFYLFFVDSFPGLPGVCATGFCMGVARARYADVIAAAFSGDPHQVAKVFHKYDGALPNAWSQPATSDTPDLSGTAGKFAPLWTDEYGSGEVIYDRSFDVYLAVSKSSAGINIRASSDLIHWSGPLGAPYNEAGRRLYYPTLMGETEDPNIGGERPRLYFSSFPSGQFPHWPTSVFESVPLKLWRPPTQPFPGPKPTCGAPGNKLGLPVCE